MNDAKGPASLPLPRSRLVLIAAIDAVAVLLGVALFVWLRERDAQAALIALVSCLVFGGFFNLVIVLVTRKP
jgi:hypothetical protein